jgi:hypothetical protein
MRALQTMTYAVTDHVARIMLDRPEPFGDHGSSTFKG